MFSGDPRKMPHARLIKQIGSRQAEELATCGAKVESFWCIVCICCLGVGDGCRPKIQLHAVQRPNLPCFQGVHILTYVLALESPSIVKSSQRV